MYPWFEQNWTWSLYCVAAYLLIIAALRIWMKNRGELRLQLLFALWNVGLALFSTLGAVRIVPELARLLLMDNGLHNSICDTR